jgi:hypothetical protein
VSGAVPVDGASLASYAVFVEKRLFSSIFIECSLILLNSGSELRDEASSSLCSSTPLETSALPVLGALEIRPFRDLASCNALFLVALSLVFGALFSEGAVVTERKGEGKAGLGDRLYTFFFTDDPSIVD